MCSVETPNPYSIINFVNFSPSIKIILAEDPLTTSIAHLVKYVVINTSLGLLFSTVRAKFFIVSLEILFHFLCLFAWI